MLTRRANGWGALAGAIIGALVMGLMPVYTQINGYLYAFIGISTCFVVGYIVSLVIPTRQKSLQGLTVYTIAKKTDES